jgi:hypothetical protein
MLDCNVADHDHNSCSIARQLAKRMNGDVWKDMAVMCACLLNTILQPLWHGTASGNVSQFHFVRNCYSKQQL